MGRFLAVRRDRVSPKEKKAVTGSSPGVPASRLTLGNGGFFDGLLGVQRTAALLTLQRLGGNQAA
ncbi:MAG TPA: hypothetical protein VG795_09390, partial [Acidimicrobiia bacterium]|nr:hypothetical protein [Acidimicrobiia bacterium]